MVYRYTLKTLLNTLFNQLKLATNKIMMDPQGIKTYSDINITNCFVDTPYSAMIKISGCKSEFEMNNFDLCIKLMDDWYGYLR